MKEFICHYCHELWHVNDGVEDKVSVCPFCAKKIYKPKVIIVTSFQTAISKTLTDLSNEILKERKKFISYLMDIGTAYRKEIHILSKACDDNAFTKLYSMSKLSISDAKTEFEKFKHFLVEEEGISDSWAKLICDSFLAAIFIEEEEQPIDESDANVLPKTIEKSTTMRESIISMLGVDQIAETFKKQGVVIGNEIKFGSEDWKIIDIDLADSCVWLVADKYSREHAFHSKCKRTTWNTCTLRKWLNNEYIRQDFSLDEIKYIIDTEVKTKVDKSYFLDVSEVTTDKVFIFDVDEYERYKAFVSLEYHPWLFRTPSRHNGHDFVVTCEKEKVHDWGVRVDYKTKIKPVIRVGLDYFLKSNPKNN